LFIDKSLGASSDEQTIFYSKRVKDVESFRCGRIAAPESVSLCVRMKS
jgi:hypothetical protein